MGGALAPKRAYHAPLWVATAAVFDHKALMITAVRISNIIHDVAARKGAFAENKALAAILCARATARCVRQPCALHGGPSRG